MSGEDRKKQLRDFLDSMVDGNQEQAQVHFHNYLEDKMKGIVNPQVDAEDDLEVTDGADEVASDDE